MKPIIEQLEQSIDLTEDQMTRAMTQIMDGTAKPDHIESFLILLHNKGETIAELTGAARVMREKASTIKAPYGAVDCCGTGGDGANTYNISTATALTAAACGVPIAKHGNRASTSQSGAADVLETLGVNLEIAPSVEEEALNTLNFAFLMAPMHHPAMAHVKDIRKQLSHRTIFNLLGPLANPAKTRLQLIGVYDRTLLIPFAQVLKNLGTKRAWVVHGSDGLDEITTTGETYIAKLDEDGTITETTVSPTDFGLKTTTLDKLTGGSAEDNAKALRAVLEGHKSAYRDIVLANTAAILVIHGKCDTLKKGVTKAAEALDSGAANQLLKDYVALSRGCL